MPFKYDSPVERLIANSVFDEYSGCWIWLGSVNNTGRPRLSVRKPGASKATWMYVTRYICKYVHGRVLHGRKKAGMHSCDTPLCVFPDHCLPRTQKANVRDCVKKGRHVSGFTEWNNTPELDEPKEDKGGGRPAKQS